MDKQIIDQLVEDFDRFERVLEDVRCTWRQPMKCSDGMGFTGKDFAHFMAVLAPFASSVKQLAYFIQHDMRSGK